MLPHRLAELVGERVGEVVADDYAGVVSDGLDGLRDALVDAGLNREGDCSVGRRERVERGLVDVEADDVGVALDVHYDGGYLTDGEYEEVEVSVGHEVRAALVGGELDGAAHLLERVVVRVVALREQRLKDEFRAGAGLQRRHPGRDLFRDDVAEGLYLVLLREALVHYEIGVLRVEVGEDGGVFGRASLEVLLALDGGSEYRGVGEAEVSASTVAVDDVRDAAAGAAGDGDSVFRPHIGERAAEGEPVSAGRSCGELELLGPAFLRGGVGECRGGRESEQGNQ